MSKKHSHRRSKAQAQFHLAKPCGVIQPRVQAVGPERFGIVTVDPAKARSKWMLADFYGRVLVPPAVVEHTADGFRQCLARLRQAEAEFGLAELIVSVERTGNYHLPPKRAFAAAGYEVRVLHPFATKQFRQPANPGDKTDEHDLAANHRATVVGFALVELPLDEDDRRLRLLVRHRRDLVEKRTALQCQIREHLHLALPGYAALFEKFWELPLPMTIARRVTSPAEVRRLGVTGLAAIVRDCAIRCHATSLAKIVAWAEQAAEPDPDAALHGRIAASLDDDRVRKDQEIQALEREIAALLVRTPYLLLLRIPGIHVVSAAEFAGEMGPITHYANANAITGRAGLFRSRYQSDAVDQSGPLVRCANRRLRAALMLIADNLLTVNQYFRGQAAVWKKLKRDPRWQRVRVANRFSRIAFALVAGRRFFTHPCCQQPGYILDKLVTFHLEHAASADELRANLAAATTQLPDGHAAEEAAPLQQRAGRMRRPKRGVQNIGDILRDVIAKLVSAPVQSHESRPTGTTEVRASH
jgi:transposase